MKNLKFYHQINKIWGFRNDHFIQIHKIWKVQILTIFLDFGIWWFASYKNQQKLKEQEVDLGWACSDLSEHAQINFFSLEFWGFLNFEPWHDIKPNSENSKILRFSNLKILSFGVFFFQNWKIKIPYFTPKNVRFCFWPFYTLVLDNTILELIAWF